LYYNHPPNKGGVTKRENMNEITVETIVNAICESLHIKKNQLARMIGVNESSISNNLSKPISEVVTKKTGRRLLSLCYVVLNLASGVYSSQAIIEGINEPTIPNNFGFKESVISALQAGRSIEPQILLEKAQQGIDQYSQKKQRANKELCSEVQRVLYA
jgi:hypothetical protein